MIVHSRRGTERRFKSRFKVDHQLLDLDFLSIFLLSFSAIFLRMHLHRCRLGDASVFISVQRHSPSFLIPLLLYLALRSLQHLLPNTTAPNGSLFPTQHNPRMMHHPLLRNTTIRVRKSGIITSRFEHAKQWTLTPSVVGSTAPLAVGSNTATRRRSGADGVVTVRNAVRDESIEGHMSISTHPNRTLAS
jgi:hypothetical protein